MKQQQERLNKSRRGFIKYGGLWLSSASLIGISGLATSCQNKSSENASKEEGSREGEGGEEEEMVSANEDLMREHGLLQRMLLIYEEAIGRFGNNEDVDPKYINQTAGIIRNFIEEYHEKLEEDYLFPRLEKAGKLVQLVQTLRTQHQAGRQVTNRILGLTRDSKTLGGEDRQQLTTYITAFINMYRPHEAREDTVLFPAFKEIVSQNEYDSLGEDFEKKEHEMFGESGFDGMVDKVSDIEKQLDIYDLSLFTPHI